jgi:hypothetical protein
MTKVQVPRTKSHINEREVLLVTPKTGMLMQIQMPRPEDGASQMVWEEYIHVKGLFQEIVDHLNATTGDAA